MLDHGLLNGYTYRYVSEFNKHVQEASKIDLKAMQKLKNCVLLINLTDTSH